MARHACYPEASLATLTEPNIPLLNAPNPRGRPSFLLGMPALQRLTEHWTHRRA
jgi:hypothetical protein